MVNKPMLMRRIVVMLIAIAIGVALIGLGVNHWVAIAVTCVAAPIVIDLPRITRMLRR